MTTPILFMELMTPEIPKDALLKEKSWMISGASSYDDLKGYCFLVPGCRKDESLGKIFEDIEPREGGHFLLELGVVLPDLYPNLNGQPEYTLPVFDGIDTQELCFSNVMARLRYIKNSRSLHALVPRRVLPKINEGEIEFIPKESSVELLRTFATSRYEITGQSAEEALETNLEICIHDLIERLNVFLKVIPFVDDGLGAIRSLAFSMATFPAVYFIIKGDSEKNGHGWISPHAGRTTFNPSDLRLEQADLLIEYLSGRKHVDDVAALLNSAQSFLDGGVMEYVLLLIVIASEVATQRYVHKRLLELQVTKTKLSEAEKDLTYSMMLNIVLVAIAPQDKKPDPDLLGRINRARSLRNSYMHKGISSGDRSEIVALFQDTKRFLSYLKDLEVEIA